MTKCLYDHSRCYMMRTIPVIYSIDLHEGYTTGGQILTITGFHFNGTDVDVRVDGEICRITLKEKELLLCEIQPRDTPSDLDVTYEGQYGVRTTVVNQDTGVTINNVMDRPKKTSRLQTEFALPSQSSDNSANWMQAWFIAP